MSSLLVEYSLEKKYNLSFSLNFQNYQEEEFFSLIKKGDIQDVIIEINRDGGKLKHDFYGGVEVKILGEIPVKDKQAILANVERLNLASRCVKYAMALEGSRFN